MAPPSAPSASAPRGRHQPPHGLGPAAAARPCRSPPRPWPPTSPSRRSSAASGRTPKGSAPVGASRSGPDPDDHARGVHARRLPQPGLRADPAARLGRPAQWRLRGHRAALHVVLRDRHRADDPGARPVRGGRQPVRPAGRRQGILLSLFIVDCALVVVPFVLIVGEQLENARQVAAERDKVQNIVNGTAGVAIIGTDEQGLVTLFARRQSGCAGLPRRRDALAGPPATSTPTPRSPRRRPSSRSSPGSPPWRAGCSVPARPT